MNCKRPNALTIFWAYELLDINFIFRCMNYLEVNIELYEFITVVFPVWIIRIVTVLTCNKILMRWKIRYYGNCDVCGATQSIEHLLYSCCYVKPLWQVVNTAHGISVNCKKILLDETFSLTVITTIITFFIYEDVWLLLSLKGTERNPVIPLSYFKNE